MGLKVVIDHCLMNAAAKATLRNLTIRPVPGVAPHSVLYLQFEADAMPGWQVLQLPTPLEKLEAETLTLQHSAAARQIARTALHALSAGEDPTTVRRDWSAEVERWWHGCRPGPDKPRLGRGRVPVFSSVEPGKKKSSRPQPLQRPLGQVHALMAVSSPLYDKVQAWDKLRTDASFVELWADPPGDRPDPGDPRLAHIASQPSKRMHQAMRHDQDVGIKRWKKQLLHPRSSAHPGGLKFLGPLVKIEPCSLTL